jgi:hypothetical protein
MELLVDSRGLAERDVVGDEVGGGEVLKVMNGRL